MNEPVWLGVSSGVLLDINNPELKDINIEDIAWSLSNINRFNGHLQIQISVARHSLEVSELVPEELQLAALLHDAPEAYLGDVTRPVKHYLKKSGVDLDDYEGFWQNLIWRKYDCVPVNKEQEQIITDADDLQLAREIVALGPEGPFLDWGRALLNKYSERRIISLLKPEICDENPRRDYNDFRKRFFELDRKNIKR